MKRYFIWVSVVFVSVLLILGNTISSYAQNTEYELAKGQLKLSKGKFGIDFNQGLTYSDYWTLSSFRLSYGISDKFDGYMVIGSEGHLYAYNPDPNTSLGLGISMSNKLLSTPHIGVDYWLNGAFGLKYASHAYSNERDNLLCTSAGLIVKIILGKFVFAPLWGITYSNTWYKWDIKDPTHQSIDRDHIANLGNIFGFIIGFNSCCLSYGNFLFIGVGTSLRPENENFFSIMMGWSVRI